MYAAITVVHVIVCLFLAVVVLLQSGKAADLAGAFGGMGSQTVFGPRGSATVLSKATTIAATIFMLTSLTLAILSTRATGGNTPDILKKVSQPATGTAAPAGTQKSQPAESPAAPASTAPPAVPAPAPQNK
jgi:preprotein translocase subunit SecG